MCVCKCGCVCVHSCVCLVMDACCAMLCWCFCFVVCALRCRLIISIALLYCSCVHLLNGEWSPSCCDVPCISIVFVLFVPGCDTPRLLSVCVSVSRVWTCVFLTIDVSNNAIVDMFVVVVVVILWSLSVLFLINVVGFVLLLLLMLM